VYGRHVKGWGEGGVGVSKDDIGIVTVRLSHFSPRSSPRSYTIRIRS
jgi:hypothetical protein